MCIQFFIHIHSVSITFARKSHAHSHKRYSHQMQTTTEKKWAKKKYQATGQILVYRDGFFLYMLSAHFGSEQDKKVHRVTWIKCMQTVTTKDKEHDV